METINLSILKTLVIFFIPMLLVFSSAKVVLAQDQLDFIKSAPVSIEEFNGAVENFKNRYRLPGRTVDKTQVESRHIKIQIDDTLRWLLTGQTDSIGKGLVFHYLFDTLSGGLNYAVSEGIQNDDLSFRPKEFDKNENGIPHKHYFKILKDGTLKKQKVTDSLDLINEYDVYRKNVRRKSWIPFIIRKTKNIKKHPRMIFHQGKELNAFIEQWKTDKPNDKLYLYIYNGVEKTDKRKRRDGATGKKRKKLRPFQVPVLRIGNDSMVFPIDNIKHDETENLVDKDYEEYTKKSFTRYRAKALDAGHVCPPHCLSLTYIRLP